MCDPGLDPKQKVDTGGTIGDIQISADQLIVFYQYYSQLQWLCKMLTFGEAV